MAAFDYIVEYKKGSNNVAADALSRRDEKEEDGDGAALTTRDITFVEPVWIDSVKEMVKNSTFF